MREPGLLRRWLAEGFRAIDALVFPWECPICDVSTTGSPFCESCRQELVEASGESCPRCAMPLGPWSDRSGGCSECRGRPLGFDQAIALGPYEGPIRNLCLRLKHETDAWLAPWLADVMIEARAELRGLPKGSLVVPIPLHWRRRWERGYNQSEALARGLARRLSLRLAQPLRRPLATPRLAKAGRTERARVMSDAFRVRRGASRTIEGRTILLVDDILTSGATAGAAARTLKRAGAARVVVAVIARAEGKV